MGGGEGNLTIYDLRTHFQCHFIDYESIDVRWRIRENVGELRGDIGVITVIR
jgi:hypothetical protein